MIARPGREEKPVWWTHFKKGKSSSILAIFSGLHLNKTKRRSRILKVRYVVEYFPAPLLCSLADPTNHQQVPNGVVDGRKKGEGSVMTLLWLLFLSDPSCSERSQFHNRRLFKGLNPDLTDFWWRITIKSLYLQCNLSHWANRGRNLHICSSQAYLLAYPSILCWFPTYAERLPVKSQQNSLYSQQNSMFVYLSIIEAIPKTYNSLKFFILLFRHNIHKYWSSWEYEEGHIFLPTHFMCVDNF